MEKEPPPWFASISTSTPTRCVLTVISGSAISTRPSRRGGLSTRRTSSGRSGSRSTSFPRRKCRVCWTAPLSCTPILTRAGLLKEALADTRCLDIILSSSSPPRTLHTRAKAFSPVCPLASQLTLGLRCVAYEVAAFHRTRTQGDAARLARFYARSEAAGATLGIAFRWGGRTGNTRASHRLIRLARERDAAEALSPSAPTPLPWAAEDVLPTPPDSQGRDAVDPELMGDERKTGWGTYQERVLEALFRGHFELERDVSDLGFLAGVAARTGLLPSAGQAAAVLAGGDTELARRVEVEERVAREMGVSASPTFVVQGRYRVGGAQEPGVFLALFEKISAGADGNGDGAKH